MRCKSGSPATDQTGRHYFEKGLREGPFLLLECREGVYAGAAETQLEMQVRSGR